MENETTYNVLKDKQSRSGLFVQNIVSLLFHWTSLFRQFLIEPDFFSPLVLKPASV